jgi:hypothetical protein
MHKKKTNTALATHLQLYSAAHARTRPKLPSASLSTVRRDTTETTAPPETFELPSQNPELGVPHAEPPAVLHEQPLRAGPAAACPVSTSTSPSVSHGVYCPPQCVNL